MFRRETEQEDSTHDEVTTQAPVQERQKGPEFSTRTVSYVGPTVVFKGELSASEGLTIEGEVEGSIRHDGRNLTIGKLGRVRAEIRAKMIDIRGRVDGEIYGDEIVHLFSTAEVTGTIHCTRILMDDGAQLNGNVDMGGELAKPRKRKLSIAERDGKITKVAG
jgi:cytoskeletal protein CcmA (bactofilin family)